MPRTESQTRDLFNNWAKTYQADVGKNGPLLGYEASLAAAGQGLLLPSDSFVLDIGIGGGALAASYEAAGCRIAGIDLSEAMLETCHTAHPDYDLRAGTFRHIPFADATFDAVISSFAFHEEAVDTRAQACAEVVRVLKPKGCLALLDIMFASPAAQDEAATILDDSWDSDEVYAQVGDLDGLLRSAGLRAVSWQHTAPFHWLVTAEKP